MEQLSLYPDYRGVSHWHDDIEFIMMMDGQMTYDINGQSMTCRPGKLLQNKMHISFPEIPVGITHAIPEQLSP